MNPEPSVLKAIPVTNTTIRIGDILTIGGRQQPVIGLTAAAGGAKAVRFPDGLVLLMPPNLELTIARRVPVFHSGTR
ncbi:hypothetical protein E1265_00900 [Streptomyces sp. 8K308]|uniref:hypothetical protein n=1 Tax=Streptomyces sp. 8K308 TaxID=2530388 RepID=UPI00104C8213|nr:hypothetical protein [Streptomyces sp. 8K308]TDC27700.1 hypothetical protein E1265_00900 [Streptomyces sp. 8K308]